MSAGAVASYDDISHFGRFSPSLPTCCRLRPPLPFGYMGRVSVSHLFASTVFTFRASSEEAARPPRSTIVVADIGASCCVLFFGSSVCSDSVIRLPQHTIGSLLNRFKDVIELRRDRRIDVLCIVESWYDSDSAVLGRLRCAGLDIVHRHRPRTTAVSLLSPYQVSTCRRFLLCPTTRLRLKLPALASCRASSLA